MALEKILGTNPDVMCIQHEVIQVLSYRDDGVRDWP